MPQYRRLYQPGATVFITLVTYNRYPYFSSPENVSKLRHAVATVKAEMPFEITGAVVLPNHIHFLWILPPNDTAYSKRVGRLKVLFTQSLHGKNRLPNSVSISRQKHRESNVWQRRFWEHTIEDEEDFEACLNYIHYNPVKHGFVSCPHLWSYSSFHSWVEKESYSIDWCCVCHGKQPQIPDFKIIADKLGE